MAAQREIFWTRETPKCKIMRCAPDLTDHQEDGETKKAENRLFGGVGTGLRFVLHERKNHWRTASQGPPGRRTGFRGARVAAGKTGNEYGVQRRSGGCGGGGESEWMV